MANDYARNISLSVGGCELLAAGFSPDVLHPESSKLEGRQHGTSKKNHLLRLAAKNYFYAVSRTTHTSVNIQFKHV